MNAYSLKFNSVENFYHTATVSCQIVEIHGRVITSAMNRGRVLLWDVVASESQVTQLGQRAFQQRLFCRLDHIEPGKLLRQF